jgi:orotidine-5'-phosphate decarboxylase
MVDLRNVYEPRDMIAAGFSYSSIGRPVTSAMQEMEKETA